MIYGVTIDDITEPEATIAAFAKIPIDRQLRLVCDKGLWLSDYQDFLDGIDRAVGHEGILYLPVDSSDTASYSIVDFEARYAKFAGDVYEGDIIEVNEVNGDWTGPDGPQKARLAMRQIHDKGQSSLLTLYVEGDDWQSVMNWVEVNWLQPLAPEPTHVGISFYPRQSMGKEPDWSRVFTDLGILFPNARLRFSEIGSEFYGANNQPIPPTPAMIREIIAKYFAMKIDHPRFDGFYGWWSFVEQMVRGPFMPDLLARCQ